MSLELAIRSKRPLMGVIGVSGTVYEVDLLLEKQELGSKKTPFFLPMDTEMKSCHLKTPKLHMKSLLKIYQILNLSH